MVVCNSWDGSNTLRATRMQRRQVLFRLLFQDDISASCEGATAKAVALPETLAQKLPEGETSTYPHILCFWLHAVSKGVHQPWQCETKQLCIHFETSAPLLCC